jgi:hypothetical protein
MEGKKVWSNVAEIRHTFFSGAEGIAICYNGLEVKDSIPRPPSFGRQADSQAARHEPFLLMSPPVQRRCILYLSMCLVTPGRFAGSALEGR